MSTLETQSAGAITPSGGGFLAGDTPPEAIFTAEDFSEEQRQVKATADRFMNEQVIPRISDFEQQKPGLARDLIRRAGDLGLLAVLVPEAYGGLEMNMTTAQVVAESVGRYAAFSTTYGAHTHIGTQPLVFFGSEEQKQQYLPRLITGEWLAAYCLTESQSGSDALNVRMRAELSPNGEHYILNGEKMWISNGGWADLYTVFAKIRGEEFTAFLVERGMEGVRPGTEERKMGLKGSSTTAVVLDNVAVPVRNLLGEMGKGHRIAFNILNIGRLELGAACVGGGKEALSESLRYAKQRKAFGRPIAEFGLMQHKLAEMAIRLFAMESLVYRTSGLIDARLADLSWNSANAAAEHLKAVEEYAIECSIAKVYCSEALDYIADEAVQIHGGYGFHQDYAVERIYRDSRVNRIFEGTSEINRLLIIGMLLKRAGQGRLDLMPAIKDALREAGGGAGEGSMDDGAALAAERRMLRGMKRAALLCAGAAQQHFGKDLESEQEVAAGVSDMVIGIFAAESALLRARKLLGAGQGDAAADMARVIVSDTADRVRLYATTVLAALGGGPSAAKLIEAVNRSTSHPPLDTISLRRGIARRLLPAERLVV